MQVLKKPLVFISLFFVIIISVLSFFIAKNSYGIFFISLKPGFALKKNATEIKSFVYEISEIKGSQSRILVILSPKFKDTSLSMGFNEDNQLYYAEWGIWENWLVLNVYLDKNVWDKYPQDKKAELFPRFLRLAIGDRFGFGLDGNEDKYKKFYGQKSPSIFPVNYFYFN